MKDYYQSGVPNQNKIDCQYIDKCTSANTWKCYSCRHNRGKRDYYDPMPYRPIPWNPEPIKPWFPMRDVWYIRCGPDVKLKQITDVKLKQITGKKTPYFV